MYISLSSRGRIVVVWGCGRRSSLRSTLPLCEMHRAAKLVRDLANQRWISTASADFIFPSAPRADISPGRKTQGQGYRPSAGLRPLNVSRVKCVGGPCRGHSVLPCTGNTISLHCAFIKGARFGICLRKHVVAATEPSPFKVGDNQRPERTTSGVENLRLSVPSPAKN